jgi:hypothetical protein
MSPSACFSNDYFTGIGSPLLELHVSRSFTVETPGSATDSPSSAVASSTPQSGSSADLQLIINLSSYPLQQLTGSSFPSSRPTTC